MESAAAMATDMERALRLFHGATDGVEIVTGGNYREEQDQDATERAYKDQGSTGRTVR